MPYIATLHLIYQLDSTSDKKGLSKNEFSIFIPTLINVNQINEYTKKILEFREEKDKDSFIGSFLKGFYELDSVPEIKINHLYDYGDNIMRYFRLTRYFKVETDPLGYRWRINIEPSRLEEVKQLLVLYDGSPIIDFQNIPDYIEYISDIRKPELPWEEVEKLRRVAISIRQIIIDLLDKEKIIIKKEEKEFIETDISKMGKEDLNNYIAGLRRINLDLKERIKRIKLSGNKQKLKEIICLLKKKKELRKLKPEQFEKLITETLIIINDELLIKPNYPVDDDGEPISHAPGNLPDIECFYKSFIATGEVTLNATSLQWVQEGQPVMRHLRDFENKYQDENKEIFCLFIAPRVHIDTYSTFWTSVKYEYNGKPQKIIPITAEQLVMILETFLRVLEEKKEITHKDIFGLLEDAIEETSSLNSFSEWADFIPDCIMEWQKRVISS